MPDLYAFDGNTKPDLVKRIEIKYHRITKIKPKVPISETIEYAVWDYTESMVIDGDSDTIEHIRTLALVVRLLGHIRLRMELRAYLRV